MFNEEWKIYEVISGSHSYGTNTEASDIDLRGIMIAPKEFYLSPFKLIEQYEESKKDRVIYELKKFFKLASDNNPNILELLWINEKFITFINEKGKSLRDNRELFFSAKCKFTYLGYSFSQMHRVKNHKRWIDNPPRNVSREDFGLSIESSYFNDNILQSMIENFRGEIAEKLNSGLIEKFSNMDSNDLSLVINDILGSVPKDYFTKFSSGFFSHMSKGIVKDEMKDIFEREIQYYLQKKEWLNYEQWKKNRNVKRSEMEKEWGYDRKFCLHILRLLLQGEEILLTGKLTVNITHHKEIQDYLSGKWSYDYLVKWVEEKNNQLDDIYNSNKYVVPKKVDVKKTEELFFKILDY